MIYVFLLISLIFNGILVWYIRKLLSKYWSDIEVREKFTQLLADYAASLESIYKLEELYGEETIKKAINETRFVQEACEEYKKILETEIGKEEIDIGEEAEEDADQATKKDTTIRLKEGESISQNASEYKRVIPEV